MLCRPSTSPCGTSRASTTARRSGTSSAASSGDKVRLHLLLPLQSTDEEQVFKSSREAAEEGFTAIKLDLLRAGYADMTLSRLIESARGIAGAAREGAGMDVDLIFEIHRKLTPMNAVALADALVEFRPLFS